MEFWCELSHSVPALRNLISIGRDAEELIDKADRIFKRLLALNPSSVQSLRLYANFLQSIANNPGVAIRLHQQADDIEDAQSKERATMAAQLTMFATGSSLDPSREDVSGSV